ncbi:MAG: TonB-dependent receptor [Steroidobacteraceae bacterium]|nr:TonB-dependent receptor [Steroidobacteraceae bacterium]
MGNAENGGRLARRSLAAAIAMALPLPAAWAQTPTTLTDVMVTAQRRVENIQDVPISVSPLEGERLDAMFEGGADIQALAARVPSLYAESSNGRLAPRFYIRGLGNSDFDLAASQPVSIIVDDVVLENVILKSFPLFDLERVEVLRGPQGSLFGRNTPAGIVKFDTRKPSQEFGGDFTLSYGELGSATIEGAVGGGLSDTISARVSLLYHERDDWIDNTFTGDSDAMGGYDEFAYRAQLLIEPSDSFSALLNIHGRDIDGTASIFRANVLGPGSDGFNSNYDRDSVSYDEGNNNPQHAEGTGGSLKLDFKFGGNTTLTSITAYETTESFSLGDIDGGFGADFLPFVGPCPPGSAPGDPCIPFPSQTQDGIDDLDQFTQEIRIASQASDRLFWQAGAYYFDSEFSVTTTPFFVAATTLTHENTAWAVFGHVSYDVTDALTVTGGVRYTDDDKDLTVQASPIPQAPQSVSDSNFSGDLSVLYKVSDAFNVFGRLAQGFRAPTIQGRDVAFFGSPSIADSETITSIEAGFKSQLADNRVRFNGSVFYYEIKDQQLSAIGGAGNLVQLVNADKGTGMGFDLEGEFLLTDRLLVTAGLSYTDTEIKDSSLVVTPCGSGLCTVLDSLDVDGNAIVDGNSFTQAPDYIATITARYGIPLANNSEFFFSTDWAFQGKTQFFIYESAESFSDDTFEGGARIGYSRDGGKWEVALFGRNITDEENVKGAIDFNNLTGFDNEPRIVGVSFKTRF